MGCLNIARRHFDGDGVALEPATAVEMFEETCDNRHAKGCRLLAGLYLEGKHVPLNEMRAWELYRRACDLHSAQACHELGKMLTPERDPTGMTEPSHPFGQEAIPDAEAIATEALKRACREDRGEACHLYGIRLRFGLGVAADPGLAMKQYERSCDLGFANGCASLGHGHAVGLGGQVDSAAARRLARQACQMQSPTACVNFTGAALFKMIDDIYGSEP
jgi:uncharacterized protein